MEDWQQVNVTNFLKDDSPSLFPKSPQELVARIYVLEDILEKCSASLDRKYFDLNSIHSCAYLSESSRITLKLKVGSRVMIEMIEDTKRPGDLQPSSMDVFPSNQSVTTKVFEDYVKFHSRHEALLLNSCSTILLDNGRRCVIQMSPMNCDYVTLNEKNMKNLMVHIRSVLNSNDAEISENYTKEKLKKISTRYAIICNNSAVSLTIISVFILDHCKSIII